jgi:DNA-binding FadR family transcriptional regulator
MTSAKQDLSEFLAYLASIPADSDQRIPPLNELSKQLGISVATLREQLEEARSLGVVDVKPKAGIKKLPYDFSAAIKPGLFYAVESDCFSYQQFADLRKHLETAYFVEAAQSLPMPDIERLGELVKLAQAKIKDTPGKVPAEEHREFHMLIYKNLHNQYLNGVLDTFWQIYHLSGLEVYPDQSYIDRVWQYHAHIVEQVKAKNYSQALVLLVEHMDLINQREKIIPRSSFE